MPVQLPRSLFKHYPEAPRSGLCQNAFVILCNAHDASSAFLGVFDIVRRGRKAKGMATDEEQDLLRAMLLFASAGLDSAVKQLIRDTLPTVIERKKGAEEMFKEFVEKRLRQGGGIDHEALADVITDHNPRRRLMEFLVEDLTSKSLQSTDELLRAASYFDIPSKEISTNPASLREIFCVRNQIAHEMDVDFTRPNRSRRPRARGLMHSRTEELFRVAKAFLVGVESRIGV